MKFEINKALLAGIMALVLLIVGSAALVYWNTRQLDDDAAWVAHTHEMLRLTSNVLVTVLQADASQTDFLLTGKEEFLQSYNPAFVRLDNILKELKDKTSDNPGQQQRLAALEQMVAGYRTWLQDGIDRRRKWLPISPEEEEQLAMSLKDGKRQMKAIHDLVANLEREERALLREREMKFRAAYSIAVKSLALATVVCLLMITTLLCLLQRSHVSQKKVDERILQANASLTDRVEIRTMELRRTTEALSQADIDLSGSEELLQQSQERSQELTAHIQQVLWMIDARAARVLYVSPGYEQMWGRSCQSLLDNSLSHLFEVGIHPLDQEMMRREDAAMYKTGHIDAEFRVLRPDGSLRWVWSRGYPVMDKDQLVRIVGVVEDITEKRRLATEREALLARLQLHIERMPLAYILFDADFRIKDWNSTAERIFGYTRDEMLGTGPPYEKYVPSSCWPEGEETRKRIRRGDMEAHSINENLTKDGRTITCQWSNTPLMDDAGTFVGLLCLAQDITERKSLEDQFRQAQKMEAVGQLAAGVAHDFNNLLTVILGYSELFLSKLPSNCDADRAAREPMVQIRRAGERAAGLTRQLLAFGRKQILAPVVLDLNALVTETEKLLQRLIGANTELTCNLQPGLGRVKADPGQVEQVIMNLVINARDAMPTGGRLTLQTSNIVLSESLARRHCGQNASHTDCNFTLLAVTDTGTGMDEATKAHIFEPFFTTKEVGKGTGLGLATVFGIVKQSGGFIEVESTAGSGSSFRIYLPQIDEAVRLKETNHDLSMPRGKETILLVEDQDGVRDLARVILEECGYKVLSTQNGGEAVRVCYEFVDVIELLFTDVVMPKMSGRQLTDLLVPFRPNMKVLYMSGYTDDTMVRHGIQDVGMNFLAKPFTPLALTRKVREVLDGANQKAPASDSRPEVGSEKSDPIAELITGR
jgi:PAS domain S-box-containing protein